MSNNPFINNNPFIDNNPFINPPKSKETFALLIAGSRDYTDYKEFRTVTDHLLSLVQDEYDVLIIEGEARGTDSLARMYAEERGYDIAPYPAHWDTYGRSAGYYRNELMVSELSLYPHRAALFFWDCQSRGTRHCISEVQKAGIDYKIFDFRKKKFIRKE